MSEFATAFALRGRVILQVFSECDHLLCHSGSIALLVTKVQLFHRSYSNKHT